MNKDCEIVRDMIPLYIDDVCSNGTKELVKKHLENCNECQEIFKTMRKNEKNENSNEKESLKSFNNKIKKNKIKAIVISLIVFVIVIILIKYIYSCILFNYIINKAQKFSKSNNMYIQSMENSLGDEVFVAKEYYKNGKFKVVYATYRNDGIESLYTKYTSVDSDESIFIYPDNRAVIQKGQKIFNTETMLKGIPFVYNNELWFRTVTPIFLSIKSKKINVGSYSNEGKKCYVLQDKFDIGMNWEIWLDKETGLPLKEINIDGMKTYYSDNKEENIDESKIDDYLKEKQDILIKSGDGITEFRYEFDVVTDEDVEVPDLSQYKVEIKEK